MRSISGVLLVFGVLVFGRLAAASPGTASAKPSSGQFPEVGSLLAKDFRSVVTKGLGQVGARGFSLRFFEHASNSEEEAVPTLLFGAGCNANSSRFRISGGRLVAFGGFTSTDMGCEVDPDLRISKLLERGMQARTFGNRLILTNPNGRVKLVLVPDVPAQPATMKRLDGKSFRSIVIRGRKVKSNSMNLSFTTGPLPRDDENGKQVEGPLMLASIGCNSMGGEYAVRGGSVMWIGETYSTAMMCFPFNDGWLSALLRNGAQARIAGPVLTLTRGKNRVVMLRRGN